MSDLRESHERGHIGKTPHYNSIFRYLESDSLTPILRDLVTESSLPLKAVETDFAVDSSGFTTSKFFRWYDHKYGRVREKHDWVKAHLICGVRTNVVTAIEIADRRSKRQPLYGSAGGSYGEEFQNQRSIRRQSVWQRQEL